MRIPTQLSTLLQTNDKLNGTVLQTISIVKPWFEDNKLVFFPEYTDHGPNHIQEVFETAESLITETAWPLLRSEDVATLILGIILHDCAMHLSEDGFLSLLSDRSRPLNAGFDDKSWPQLWDQFMAEAKRFDERKLKALFDDVEPVRTPSLDPIKLSKRDRLLIGEFLRRHHPRLAHEIALLGIPGPKSMELSLGDIPHDIKELAGLVARSHGLDLRVCVDYLNKKSKWGARRTRGVHVTYLMVLVRIADYVQIHSSRAPQELLQVRSLRSPVSRREWDVHAAVKDIHQETDDPEALWIEGQPEDVRIYLKLKHLLSDIQREIDDSWAILGEVYGPKEELRELGVRLRRIKSNLHDPSFPQTVTYIPCQAALHTAGVDLLKLLIRPLYGDKPEVGIRELVQNSVDACRELKDYLEKNRHFREVDLQEQNADVVIELHQKEDGSKWVTVSDRGIGMTVDTILNYFLKAGASFRNSFAWRKQHEDDHGDTQVLRSGRFGIGVLAGFLLGKEIHVTTRHVTAQPHEGISFSCRLEDEHIQLNRITRSVGTTASIQIQEVVFIGLLGGDWKRNAPPLYWDWYCLAEPSVHRSLPTGELTQRFVLPAVDASLPPNWRRTSHLDYRDIHWSYSQSVLQLTCNGLAVADLNDGYDMFGNTSPYPALYKEPFEPNGMICPKLSIFDPHGNLPLNLQRTALAVDRLPFEEELITDICFDILAFLLVYTPGRRPPSNRRLKSNRHPGVIPRSWYYYSDEGVALLDPWNIRQLQTPRISAFSNHLLLNAFGNESFQPNLGNIDEDLPNIVSRRTRLGWIGIKNHRLVINRRLLNSLKRRRTRRGGRELQGSKEWINDDWQLLTCGACPPLELELEKFPFQLNANEPNFLLVVYPSQEEIKPNTRLSEVWRELIRLPHIPYDLAKRKEQLANAYRQLSTQISAWETNKPRIKKIN